MSNKIISTFQQRRQLAQDIDAMGETRTEAELTAAARKITREYPHDLVLTELLKRLGTPKSQLRGGSGHLAALLPSDSVAPALRNVVANRQNAPQVRITASLLLERFLGESMPQALISDLEASNEVAFQSLREAVEEGAENRHILLEYVLQMRQTEASVAFMVMEMLQRLEPHDRVELLRLIAQDDREAVARRAIGYLEELGATDAAVAAARALHILHLALPPALAELAERSLRKLQFGGAIYRPPRSDGWRALLSPTEAGGNQTVWLINMPEGRKRLGSIIGAVVNLRAGILHLFASDTAAAHQAPPPHRLGELVPVNTGEAVPSAMLEAPFDYGRWLLYQAQTAHWNGTAVASFPHELKLYNDLIWQFAPPDIDPEIRGILDGGQLDAWQETSMQDLLDSAEALMAHPAMEGWLRRNPVMLNMLELAEAQPPSLPIEAVIHHLLKILASWPGHTQMLDALMAGLRGQAVWLHLNGDESASGQAQLQAGAVTQLPVERNPLLIVMLLAAIDDPAKS